MQALHETGRWNAAHLPAIRRHHGRRSPVETLKGGGRVVHQAFEPLPKFIAMLEFKPVSSQPRMYAKGNSEIMTANNAFFD
jgi:hypothetical protein